MKRPYFGLIATLATGLLLTTTMLSAADEKMPKMTTAQMEAMCKSMDEKECQAMMRGMLKRKDLHKMIKEEIKADKEFSTFLNQHPGGG
jgi:hypothetical protein